MFAILAGVAWGVGGYFEKMGLRSLGLPPIVGITLRTATAFVILGAISIPAWKSLNTTGVQPWLMIIIGGGVVAGSLGMWSFYSSLSMSENLGATLAIAFDARGPCARRPATEPPKRTWPSRNCCRDNTGAALP